MTVEYAKICLEALEGQRKAIDKLSLVRQQRNALFFHIMSIRNGTGAVELDVVLDTMNEIKAEAGFQ